MPKKPKRNSLQEAYEAFLASQQEQEVVDAEPAEPSPFPTRDIQYLIPGCWIKLECPSPVPGYPGMTYAAQVERVTEKSIVFVTELTTSIGRSQFIGEFLRNSKYTIVSQEEGERILNSRLSLLGLNRQMVADGIGNNLSGLGGFGFAGENNHRSSSSDSSTNDQDGFLSPGYD